CSLTACKIATEIQNLPGDSLILFLILFNLFVVAMLALDLGVFHRRAHQVRFREALAWSVMWIALAAVFAAIIYFWHGRVPALEFVTGYTIELSLSVDNLFVFLLIFRYFRVPGEDQHKVLFWGIIGALIMRAVFILLGVSLIRRFHWIIYVFGALLVYSGIRLFSEAGSEVHPEKNPVLRLSRRWVPVTPDYHSGKFFVRQPALFATPLLVVLMCVSIKMLVSHYYQIPTVVALGVVAGVLLLSVLVSVIHPKRAKA